MSFTLSERDKARLEHVHPDLVAVVRKAAEYATTQFIVVEGLRTIARQKQLVAERKSKTMNSRHIPAKNGFGHAVDLVIVSGGVAQWGRGGEVAKWMKQAASDLGTPIEWGGDWTGSWDKPHFQLPWKSYPGRSAAALGSSRTMHGIMASGTGVGVSNQAEGIGTQVDTILGVLSPVAESSATVASIVAWLKIAGTVLTLGGLAYAAYARWDDAGRPRPAFIRRIFG
jgi:peptidoglycan LD-endopeptidase CwlK